MALRSSAESSTGKSLNSANQRAKKAGSTPVSAETAAKTSSGLVSMETLESWMVRLPQFSRVRVSSPVSPTKTGPKSTEPMET